jgi:inosine/xanthosine triphosphate pyrophosphatase family protein
VIHLFFKIAWKVDEAVNFAFVLLIVQEPGIYAKRHADHARQDKIDLAWERISHEMKESGWLVCMYVCMYVRIITKI